VRIVKIPKDAVSLVLDEDLRRRNWFLSSLRMPDAHLAHDAARAIDMVKRIEFGFIWLDYELGPGLDSIPVAEHLRDTRFAGAIYVHSQNPFGVGRIRRVLPTARVMAWGSFEVQRST
jgi:hypothetical protein